MKTLLAILLLAGPSNLASTGFFTPGMVGIRKEKPVIMGEFGAFDHVEKTLEEAVDNMARVRETWH